MSILNILETLASDSGRNFKIDYLKGHANDELLKRVVFLALDPFTQFFIRKIPKYEPNATDHAASLQSMLPALNDLSSRTVTGHAAIDRLTNILQAVSAADAKVIERIIEKDLRCGVSDSTANKVWPGLIPEYPCMLASGYDDKLISKIQWPAYVQLKMDGMRFNAIVKNGKCEFRSRNGKLIDIPSNLFPLPFIAMAEHYKDDIVFDGELLVVDEDNKPLDRKTGNGILNKAVKGTMSEKEAESVRATIWDAIPAESFWQGECKEPYSVRFAKLYNSVMDMTHSHLYVAHLIDLIIQHHVNDIHEARALFTRALENGQEGIILKSQQGIWENKRAKHQIKFKAELECDLMCVGWEEGTGKNVGRLGALQLESACGKLKVGVGSGFTDNDRDIIGRDTVGKIITVKYNAIVDDKSKDTKSLFLPIYLEVRQDKTEADTLAKLEAQ